MGCDIHSYVEVKHGDKWEQATDLFPLEEFWQRVRKKEKGDSPFDCRHYGMFGFLANVRNYSHVPCIAEPKYAIPEDASDPVKEQYEYWDSDAHTATWLTLKQLLDFSYDQLFWDRRVMKQTAPNCWNGAALADEGEGEHLTVRKFLGDQFFRDLEIMRGLGEPENVRVVFWFDN